MGAAGVPESSGVSTNVSEIGYRPGATSTVTGSLISPAAFIFRMASRAPVREARGWSTVPDRVSSPAGATWSVTPRATVEHISDRIVNVIRGIVVLRKAGGLGADFSSRARPFGHAAKRGFSQARARLREN